MAVLKLIQSVVMVFQYNVHVDLIQAVGGLIVLQGCLVQGSHFSTGVFSSEGSHCSTGVFSLGVSLFYRGV